MLKTRIMPILLYKNFELVKGKRFDSWRHIGSAIQSVKVYNMREVDELVFLDINATDEKRDPDYMLIDEIADECFMPLTVGGGISEISQIKKLLDVGADKISINTAAVENPKLITNASNEFGAQCIVVSIDVKLNEQKKYNVITHSGSVFTDIDPIIHSKNIEALGAGEILLTSINCDGTMLGYDLNLINLITKAVDIPVIAAGGAGNYEDMYLALTIGRANAVAASSIFHFTQQTPLEAKKYLKNKGINVRS